MLRGVIDLSDPVTGARFIDILKLPALRVIKDASGDMLAADGVLARNRVQTGVGGIFLMQESVKLGFGTCQRKYDSQCRALRSDFEQLTHRHSPRGNSRGPIEARHEIGARRRDGRALSAG